MTIYNMIEKWKKLNEEIENDSIYKDEAYFRIKPLEMDLYNAFYMAMNIRKNMLIYIEFPANCVSLKTYNFPFLSGIKMKVKNEKNISSNNEYLIIEKNEECPEELFLSLCISLVEKVKNSTTDKETILYIDIVLKEYSNLLKKKSKVLSKEEEQGLYCELVYLEELMEIYGDNAVEYWTGPQKNKHDFILDKQKSIEVKSTTNQEQLIVRISNENQLDYLNLEELRLVVFVVENNNPCGEKLDIIIKRIISKIQNIEMHTIFLTGILSFMIDPYEYKGNHQFLIIKKYIFLVDEKFPRITKANIPSNIYDVKYYLNLSNQKEVCENDNSIIDKE